MGANSKIAWTHHTFNPWWGCTKVSAGCAKCYAERDMWRYGQIEHFGRGAPRRFFGDKHWREPLRWNAAAEQAGERRRVFCGSMCDVFEDRPELKPPRERLLDLIYQTKSLDWLLLTKRPEKIDLTLGGTSGTGWSGFTATFPNVWLGVTVENNDNRQRWRDLLNCIAVVRFLSVEPMLGPIDFGDDFWETGNRADWVIFGAESDRGGRPGRDCPLEWVRDGLAQCRAAGVPAFVKQLHIDGRLSKDPAEWPEDLRVHEFPHTGATR